MERTTALPASAACTEETTNAPTTAATPAITIEKRPFFFIKLVPGLLTVVTRMDASLGAWNRMSTGIIVRNYFSWIDLLGRKSGISRASDRFSSKTPEDR